MYKGYIELEKLAELIGTEIKENKIDFQGKVITAPSETNMIHIDKKRFKTAENALEYLTNLKPHKKETISENHILDFRNFKHI